jgi:hypothetical protein
MNITVIRRISGFLSCALQPTEASDVSKPGRLFATGIVHHWNTKVVFIETKKELRYSAQLVQPPSPRRLAALHLQNWQIGREFHLQLGEVEACRKTT